MGRGGGKRKADWGEKEAAIRKVRWAKTTALQCPSLHGATLHSSQTRRQRENKKEREREGEGGTEKNNSGIRGEGGLRESYEEQYEWSLAGKARVSRETAFVFRMCVMNTEALELELWVFGCLM